MPLTKANNVVFSCKALLHSGIHVRHSLLYRLCSWLFSVGLPEWCIWFSFYGSFHYKNAWGCLDFKWRNFLVTYSNLFSTVGAALFLSSRRLLIKTHGTSLIPYHLWLPLPIPLAMLWNYVRDKTGSSRSDMESDDKGQEPDKLLSSIIVHSVLIFF